MKLIDATSLILSSNIIDNKIRLKGIIKVPEVNPVHVARGCYCKEKK